MSVQIAVRIADEDLERLDAAVARGAFPTRAAAIREGLLRLLGEEREAQIAAAYRRAYASSDEDHDDAVGQAGLTLGAATLAGEDPAGAPPA